MKISLIGAGRVAHHLVQAFAAEHDIVQIYSRTFAQAQLLAAQVGAEAVSDIALLQPEVELCIMAVSDQSIAGLIPQLHLQLPETLIVHTSGSTHLNVLSVVHERSGVFYPLQTFSLGRQIDWQQTPLFTEAVLPDDQKVLTALAQSLSQRVYEYSSEQRLSLHLAAVFACNFSNYCYDMAKQVVDARHVDFSLLYPLILETAHKAVQNDPAKMQTGPALRKDTQILNMHQHMLSEQNRDDLQQIYSLMSQQIMDRHPDS